MTTKLTKAFQVTRRDDLAGYYIEHTAKRLKRAFQRTLSKLDADITADQWVILHMVYSQEGLSQREIAYETSKDGPTVTRILDLMRAKRLIVRMPDRRDRRRFGVHLTAHGRATVDMLLPKVRSFRSRHFEGLSNADVQSLIGILGTINSNIKTN